MAYLLTGRKCGTLRFEPDTGTINKESMSKSSKMTSNAIEDGGEINDHVIKNPEQFQIGGVIIGGDSAVQTLLSMWEQRDLMSYSGRFHSGNLIITNVTGDFTSKNRDGCNFSATLQKVNMVSSAYVEISGNMLMSQEDGQSGTKSTGRTTTKTESVSGGAYADYVNSYSGGSSSGPSSRHSAGYNGVLK